MPPISAQVQEVDALEKDAAPDLGRRAAQELEDRERGYALAAAALADQPQGHADEQPKGDNPHGDEERDPGAVDNPAYDRAAQLVGA